jgi:hypothetical protein
MTKVVVLDDNATAEIDYSALVNSLEAANSAIADGDLRCVEAMLLDQSHVLQSVFMLYTQKMAHAEYTEHVDAYCRIALRAQNQCRQTLASLVELKNPKRATFIKQQNNAVNQQINQHAEIQKKSDKQANELIGEVTHEQLDTRTAQASCRVNTPLETVGELDRTENSRR